MNMSYVLQMYNLKRTNQAGKPSQGYSVKAFIQSIEILKSYFFLKICITENKNCLLLNRMKQQNKRRNLL